ncbi:MAG TPA: hypothetical protein VFN85_09515 [Solirubrobacterales bacterium]|nr:hypothetical protein [Solirubrobacterales bacterium]
MPERAEEAGSPAEKFAALCARSKPVQAHKEDGAKTVTQVGVA